VHKAYVTDDADDGIALFSRNSASDDSDEEDLDTMFRRLLVNKERRAAGLPPLRKNIIKMREKRCAKLTTK